MQRWYASVMLNRLMFIYFIQKKGFLDSDPHYLRTKLTQSQQRGKDPFMLSIFRIKMWGRMVIVGHTNYDTKEFADAGHIFSLYPRFGAAPF